MIEANELLKEGGFEYTFCGSQAIHLFLGYESRTHGDIDVCAFWNERDIVIQYMQSLGLQVFEMLGERQSALYFGRVRAISCKA